jgi:hypothetical protein
MALARHYLHEGVVSRLTVEARQVERSRVELHVNTGLLRIVAWQVVDNHELGWLRRHYGTIGVEATLLVTANNDVHLVRPTSKRVGPQLRLYAQVPSTRRP